MVPDALVVEPADELVAGYARDRVKERYSVQRMKP